VEALAETSHVSFHSGIAGCGWAIEHLGRPDGIDPEINRPIDEALGEIVSSRPDWLEYELLAGGIGFAIYALERAAETGTFLAELVDFFEHACEQSDSAIAWRTPDASHVARVRGRGATYAFGPAHGAAGVVAALAAIAAVGIEPDRARTLVDGSLRGMREHALDRPGMMFSPYRGDDIIAPGWCNGDLGIAGALAAAGAALGDRTINELALATAARAAESVAADPFTTPGLCHGWAGAGHAMARLYHRFGDERFAAASRAAFARLVQTYALGDDLGLLTGSAGIGLALLSATTAVEPAWDRALLLS
jgi:hypothetical protein